MPGKNYENTNRAMVKYSRLKCLWNKYRYQYKFDHMNKIFV